MKIFLSVPQKNKCIQVWRDMRVSTYLFLVNCCFYGIKQCFLSLHKWTLKPESVALSYEGKFLPSYSRPSIMQPRSSMQLMNVEQHILNTCVLVCISGSHMFKHLPDAMQPSEMIRSAA